MIAPLGADHHACAPEQPGHAGPGRTGLLHGLVAVARRHGVPLSVERLRHENQLADDRLDPEQLETVARRAGLLARTVRLRWAGLTKLGGALPALVTLTNGRCLVLAAVRSTDDVEEVALEDPLSADGAQLVIGRERLESAWTGRVVLIKRDHAGRDEEKPFGLGFVADLLLRERRIVRDVVISAGVLSLLALVPILFYRLMTDQVLSQRSLSTFTVLCVALAVLLVFEVVFTALRRLLVLHLVTRVDVRLANYVFEKTIRLPMSVFEEKPVGLVARDMNEVYRLRQFLVTSLFGTILDSICLLIFIPIMAAISPALTIFVLACCALIGLWTALLLPMFRRRNAAVLAAEGSRGAFLVQTLQGMRTVKSLALEPRQLRLWDVHAARIARLRFSEGVAACLIEAGVVPLERLMISGTLALAVYLALTAANDLFVATIFVFLLLSQRIAGPLRQMATLVQHYDDARSALVLVAGLVNQPGEASRPEGAVTRPIEGRVEFDGVRFRYPGTAAPALDGVSFAVPRGTTLGVMGRSGSGKTTLTRLLQRLHTDYAGLIKVDGIDVRQYDLDHLRSSMGVVLQENFLFSGTIRETIAAAKVDASFDEVVRAARLAGAEEFIDRLPRGYETFIYEGSPNLSGGQRQRLAIARALITDPRILILDEATSALDPDSEAIVNANLQRIAQGRTVIVISHRLSSLVEADAILVLERGAVHDVGRHPELLARCELYRDLWLQQNPPQEPVPAPRARLVAGGRGDG